MVPPHGLEPRTYWFIPLRLSPPRQRRFVVWTFSSPCLPREVLGGCRQVSTRSIQEDLKSFARDCQQLEAAKVSPNLTPVHLTVSNEGCNMPQYWSLRRRYKSVALPAEL